VTLIFPAISTYFHLFPFISINFHQFPSISINFFFNYYLRGMFHIINKILVFLLSFPVHIYRYSVSPFLRPACRHVPSCSQFALDALKIHGAVRGLAMGTGRILRCRPGGTHGYDPVPLFWIKKYKPWPTFWGKWKACNRLKEPRFKN
jgi:putative membrane protein insertion efficiency factor